MADYSGLKPYLEENNLQYFTFSPNSEKRMKAVMRHLPPDTPADVSNSLEGLGFNVINVRQLTTIRRAPNVQTHLETLPLFLVTLIRNAKSQEIFKLNSLNHITYYRGISIQSSNWPYTMFIASEFSFPISTLHTPHGKRSPYCWWLHRVA
jgi:hypothetical protein